LIQRRGSCPPVPLVELIQKVSIYIYISKHQRRRRRRTALSKDLKRQDNSRSQGFEQASAQGREGRPPPLKDCSAAERAVPLPSSYQSPRCLGPPGLEEEEEEEEKEEENQASYIMARKI